VFLAGAKEEVKALESKLKRMDEQFREVVALYGEDVDKAVPEEFFRVFFSFVTAFQVRRRTRPWAAGGANQDGLSCVCVCVYVCACLCVWGWGEVALAASTGGEHAARQSDHCPGAKAARTRGTSLVVCVCVPVCISLSLCVSTCICVCVCVCVCVFRRGDRC
jgi:hypothetical protein